MIYFLLGLSNYVLFGLLINKSHFMSYPKDPMREQTQGLFKAFLILHDIVEEGLCALIWPCRYIPLLNKLARRVFNGAELPPNVIRMKRN